MESNYLAGIIKHKIDALERKLNQTSDDLGAQIALLECAHAEASRTGAYQAALRLEKSIQKLRDVQAHAVHTMTEYSLDLRSKLTTGCKAFA